MFGTFFPLMHPNLYELVIFSFKIQKLHTSLNLWLKNTLFNTIKTTNVLN